MEQKVISRSNLPVKMPIMGTLFYYLCLEHWKAPEWLYGVYYTIFAIVWIITIWQIVIQKNIDIFKSEENEPTEQKRPTFLEKLEGRMKIHHRKRNETTP